MRRRARYSGSVMPDISMIFDVALCQRLSRSIGDDVVVVQDREPERVAGDPALGGRRPAASAALSSPVRLQLDVEHRDVEIGRQRGRPWRRP